MKAIRWLDRKIVRKLFILVLTILFTNYLTIYLYAQKEATEFYFNQGVEKYLKGDFESAIKNLEDAYNIEPDNKKVKTFLVQVYVERASQFYIQRNYSSALRYIERAKTLDPTNSKVLEIYQQVRKESAPPPPPAPVEKPKEITKPVEIKEEVKETRKIDDKKEKEKIRKLEETLSALQKEQRKKLESIPSIDTDKFEKIISKSDDERKKIFESLEKRDEDIKLALKKQRTMILGVGVASIVLIGFIVILTYTVTNQQIKKRESFIAQRQERLLNMMYEQNRVLVQGSARLMIEGGTKTRDVISVEEMLSDPNARIRARGIEIIEAELVDEKQDVAAKILQPFLEDRHNRVRANAAKALFKFNPEVALSSLVDMSRDPDKWMRISAAYTLGELESPEAIQILALLADDKDPHVMKRAMLSLDKLKKSSSDKITQEHHKRIEEIIDGHKDKLKEYMKDLKISATESAPEKFTKIGKDKDDSRLKGLVKKIGDIHKDIGSDNITLEEKKELFEEAEKLRDAIDEEKKRLETSYKLRHLSERINNLKEKISRTIDPEERESLVAELKRIQFEMEEHKDQESQT